MSQYNFDEMPDINVRVTIRLRGKNYALVPASYEACGKFKDSVFNAMKIGGTPDNPTINGMTGPLSESHIKLLTACLVEVTEEGDKKVAETFVRNLPNPVAKMLIDRAVEISGIKSEGETLETIDKSIAALEARRERFAKTGGESGDAKKSQDDSSPLS